MILLDNQSTTDIFCNRKLVKSVWDTDERTTVMTNGGDLVPTKKAYIRNYGEIWFDENAITNILCLKNVVKKGLRVTYDSDNGSSFVVHKPDGNRMYFRMHPNGLHYYNPSERDVSMVLTVKKAAEGYSQRQVNLARTARQLQSMVGHPSTRDLKHIVKCNMLTNCPVSVQDIERAEKIFGPSVPILKGKTTRKTPDAIVLDYVAVPRSIIEANKNLNLFGDIFYINRQANKNLNLFGDIFYINRQAPFLITLGDHINFMTTSHVTSSKSTNVVPALKKVKNKYNMRGFDPKTIIMDGEFESMRSEINEIGLELNTTAANEHVPKIERQIRVIKERTRCIRHTLPFKFIPLLMVVEMVYMSCMWINAFPPKGGVSETLSPRHIMTGQQFDYNKHCKWAFGEYGQTHEENNPPNSQAARAIGAICLGPTGNLQGSYKFLNLRTGQKITRRDFTPLPMPDEIIERVNELGKADRQPQLMTFYDRHGRPIGEISDYEITGVPYEEQAPDDNNVNVPDVASSTEADDGPLFYDVEGDIMPTEPEPVVDTEFEAPDFDQDVDQFEDPQQDMPIEELTEDIIPENELQGPIVETVPESEPDTGDTEIPIETPQPRRSGRKRAPVKHIVPDFTSKKYAETTHAQVEVSEEYAQAEVTHYVMLQLSLKAGLKQWKDRGTKAVSKELAQLHYRDVYTPLDVSTLSKEEKDAALESHLFLKDKHHTDDIKGRLVADGNKQRGTIDPERATSPTVSTESVLLTAVIDAHEGREVATVDIPNAFVQTDLNPDEMIVMRLRGRLAELMVKVAPEVYSKYVVYDNKGQMMLYVRLRKALYGIMRAAILFYEKFVKDIEEIGFKINPYDPCVANKMVDGKQLTITWHVDDLKISHIYVYVVDDVIVWLREKYETLV